MTIEQIYETLACCIDYEEYMITYNEIIPDIAKIITALDTEQRKSFFRMTYNLKKKLKFHYEAIYSCEYIRKLREAKYIYNIDITKFVNELYEMNRKHIKFKKLFT